MKIQIDDLEVQRCRNREAAGFPTQNSVFDRVKDTYTRRRRRDRKMGNAFLGEPCWDLLLGTYIAAGEGRRTSIQCVSALSGAPEKTALRWVSVLEELGYITREKDHIDRRRYWLLLTDKAKEEIHAVFA